MKCDHVKFRRAKETKFLLVDQEVFDKLSPYALKVYGQLRKLTSFTNETDETEITVKNLAANSGISIRKTFDVLNELEHEHHIIQRHNIYHIRYGQINTFDVSQTYGFFKPVQEITSTVPETPPVDNFVQNLSPPAPYAVPHAQYAAPTAPNADLYIQEVFQEVSKKKQNKEPVNPSVFSDTESVKTHLNLVIANRKVYVEDDIIDQGIHYAFETNKDKRFDSVNKKLNIFLKKVREGKWLIPQGWNGISSQSIRDKEEQEHKEKEKQWQEDAQIFQSLRQCITQGEGFKGFTNMVKKLKDDVNDYDSGAMQEKTI